MCRLAINAGFSMSPNPSGLSNPMSQKDRETSVHSVQRTLSKTPSPRPSRCSASVQMLYL